MIRVREVHLLLAMLGIGCDAKRTPATESTAGAGGAGQPVSAAGTSRHVGVCSAPSGGLRLGLDTVAALGIMFVNSGDDSEGADVALCRVPGLTFLFDTLPAPADTRVRAFAGIRATEKLPYRRVEQRRDSVVLNTTQRACHRAGVT